MASKKKMRPDKTGKNELANIHTKTSRWWVAAIFGLLLFAYLVNGDSMANNDSIANVYLPIQILTKGRLTFTEADSPQMFYFELRSEKGNTSVKFHSWDFIFQGKSMREHRLSGALSMGSPLYCLSPTKQPGVYANTFGLGAGFLALPLFALIKPFASSLGEDPTRVWLVGKIVAAAAVAGSAIFLFLGALSFLGKRTAFTLAMVYGLCTCVWSTSSQALWQHGPAELFLAMGIYFLLRRQRYTALMAGLAFALAVACRPTTIFALGAVTLVLGMYDRRRLLHLFLGALPVGVLLILYSLVIFGSPFAAGQLGMGSQVALAKTGNPSLWQTPLYLGTLGLLVSPSRGLLVYSPIAILGLWGVVRVWRDPAWKDLRPVALAAVAMFLLAAKWFDWWGGWCYGYRPIVDVVLLLSFLAIPVIPWIKGRWRLLLCATLCCWSFGLQALGAYCYDVSGWNGRWVFDVNGPGPNHRVTYNDYEEAARHARERGGTVVDRALSVDDPAHRHRLWSIMDNPISYYLLRVDSARERRLATIADFLREGKR
jgi:hypothetical protein